LVSEPDDQSVFGRIVLVLVLDNQSLSCIIVSLAFSSSSVLSLESFEIGCALNVLNESHLEFF
jgi:hypothetical protein